MVSQNSAGDADTDRFVKLPEEFLLVLSFELLCAATSISKIIRTFPPVSVHEPVNEACGPPLRTLRHIRPIDMYQSKLFLLLICLIPAESRYRSAAVRPQPGPAVLCNHGVQPSCSLWMSAWGGVVGFCVRVIKLSDVDSGECAPASFSASSVSLITCIMWPGGRWGIKRFSAALSDCCLHCFKAAP